MVFWGSMNNVSLFQWTTNLYIAISLEFLFNLIRCEITFFFFFTLKAVVPSTWWWLVSIASVIEHRIPWGNGLCTCLMEITKTALTEKTGSARCVWMSPHPKYHPPNCLDFSVSHPKVAFGTFNSNGETCSIEDIVLLLKDVTDIDIAHIVLHYTRRLAFWIKKLQSRFYLWDWRIAKWKRIHFFSSGTEFGRQPQCQAAHNH